MTNQKPEFSFYFNFERITNCDPEYLKKLYKDEPNAEEIIEGIIDSKKRWDDEHNRPAVVVTDNSTEVFGDKEVVDVNSEI